MEKIKILLAEDHAVVRESIRSFLSRQSDFAVVGEAADGTEAVELTCRLLPDVVIMDIAMPKLNGIDAIKQIKKLHPATTVLILTAYDYEEYIFAMLEAGAAGYLLKDVTCHQLVNSIREVHNGESILHPAIARKVVAQFKRQDKPSERQPQNLLSEGEMLVLKAAAEGLSNKDIAKQLCLSARTVEARLGSIFDKLGVGSRTEAVIRGLKAGWFTVDDLA